VSSKIGEGDRSAARRGQRQRGCDLAELRARSPRWFWSIRLTGNRQGTEHQRPDQQLQRSSSHHGSPG